MLAERFHMDEDYLKALNPEAVFGRPGTVIKVANIGSEVGDTGQPDHRGQGKETGPSL